VDAFERLHRLLIKEDLLKNGLKHQSRRDDGRYTPGGYGQISSLYTLGDYPHSTINQNDGFHFLNQHEIDLAQHYYHSVPLNVRPIDPSALNQTAEQLRFNEDLTQFGRSLPGVEGKPDFLGGLTGKWFADSPERAAHVLWHETEHDLVDVQDLLHDPSLLKAFKWDLSNMDEATKHAEHYFIQDFNPSDPSTFIRGPNEAVAETAAALHDPKPIEDDIQILKDFPHTATYVKELETHYDKYRLPLGAHDYDRHIDTSNIDTSPIGLSHPVLDDSSQQALPLDDLHQSLDNSKLAIGDAQHAMDGFLKHDIGVLSQHAVDDPSQKALSLDGLHESLDNSKLALGGAQHAMDGLLHHDIGVLSHHAMDIDHAAGIASHVTAMHHDFSPSYLKMLILGQALLFGIWKSQEDFLGTNAQFVAFKIDNAKQAAKNFLTSDGLVGSSWKYIAGKAHEVTHKGDEERAFVTLGKSKMAEYGSRANVLKGRIFGLAKAVAEPVMIFAIGAAVAGTSTTLVPIAVGLGISAFGACKIDNVLDVTGKTRKAMDAAANFLASAKEVSEHIISLPTRASEILHRRHRPAKDFNP
jgi:hypothetical protein